VVTVSVLDATRASDHSKCRPWDFPFCRWCQIEGNVSLTFDARPTSSQPLAGDARRARPGPLVPVYAQHQNCARYDFRRTTERNRYRRSCLRIPE